MDSAVLISILTEATDRLVSREAFDSGFKFHLTQGYAICAYNVFLRREGWSDERKLKGFFELPTGIGKSAIIAGILDEALRISEERGVPFEAWVFVPRLNLAEQLKGDFEKFAPRSANRIGLVNGHVKDYRQPITISTYESWFPSIERGEFQPETNKHRMIISDEGHRGLSQNRIELLKQYEGEAVCLAFTATASFDRDKTVEKTHVNQIYHESIALAVMGGELAAYIQTRRYCIRVAPQDELEIGIEDTWQYRAKIKRTAWSKRVIEILRDSHDIRTGDPYSDNQAAFYCDGIDHANQLEEMLRTDEELWAKAKRMGMEGVAVSIHSGMTDNEQRDRLEAYKSGQYMAIVGDAMFKEGFDHPPMKTVFDYPRGSLVDKSQILGRGARKWWNETKQRYEGLTFIDTFVYIGSQDSVIDAENRREAFRKTVTARDVLENSYILGPGVQDVIKGPSIYPPGPQGVEDQYVDSTSDLDDEFLIDAEIEQLREEQNKDYIEITEEYMKFLLVEKRRTGMGSDRITGMCPELELLGVTVEKIAQIHVGNRKWTGVQWKLLLACYNSQPTVITLAEHMIASYEREVERTEQRAVAIMNSCPELVEAGIPLHKIQSITAGVRNWTQSQWDLLLACYRRQPTARTLTERMVASYESEVRRTGLGATVLIRLCPELLSSDVTNSKIRYIATGVDGWTQSQWDLLMECYQKQPTAKNTDPRISLTEHMVASYEREAERTGQRAAVITKKCPELIHAGITSHKINDVAAGVGSWTQFQWDLLLACYSKQPTAREFGTRITLTEHMVAIYESEAERTGQRAAAMMSRCHEISEAGITSHKINAVAVGVGSWTQHQWDLLITCYNGQPTAKNSGLRISLTEHMVTSYESEAERTGKRAIAITNKCPELVEAGITSHKIDAVAVGVGSWTQHQWDLLMECYQKQPAKGQSKALSSSALTSPVAPDASETLTKSDEPDRSIDD